jgi:adenylate kinase family enzyme
MVILIGGGSSVGKTTAAADLARRRGLQHLEVDALRAEESHPAVHFVASSPDVWQLGAETLRDRLIELGAALRPRILRLVSKQLALGVPTVIEGEGIEPSLLESLTDRRVRMVFVAELNEKRLAETFANRPSAGADRFRLLGPAGRQCVCRMNRLYGAWIAAEALARGLPCLPSQPWQDLADRIFAAVTAGPAVTGWRRPRGC